MQLRESKVVMNLTRLGSLHQTRLSFVRSILRKVFVEKWQIKLTLFDLDCQGIGTCVYQTTTKNAVYSCIIYAHKIADEDRTDRVIAKEWDITFALVSGKADDEIIETLRKSVPLQEAGRNNPRVLVLSRANRSVRNFAYIIECLSKGQQPDPQKIAQVGYLYRTTAVYGNGKFGIADYSLLCNNDDFSRPFAAQMFAVYLLRDFCTLQVEHIAKNKSDKAVELQDKLNRYLGIGNSTGLGMAPFLVNHPGLLSSWVLVLETAIAKCLEQKINNENQKKYQKILAQAIQYFKETTTVDEIQQARYDKVIDDALEFQDFLKQDFNGKTWQEVLVDFNKNKQFESSELFYSILLELFPNLIDNLCDEMSDDEFYQLDAGMTLSDMKILIENKYYWALEYDFSEKTQDYWFWYVSEDKEEPRIGVNGEDLGKDKQTPLCIAWRVQNFYKLICDFLNKNPDSYLADFLLQNPQRRGIARRVQSMAKYFYSEIEVNLFAENMRPLDLLRAKLSFFGASKFDPKSDKWVRITMYQGAPTLKELSKKNDFYDDWYFPLAPVLEISSN